MISDQSVFRTATRLAIVAACCFALLGCGVPGQYIMASVPGDHRIDAPVRIHRSAADNLQTWVSDVLFLCTPGSSCTNVEVTHVRQPSQLSLATATYGRGGGSPGIASNGEFYVMAFWGRRASNRPIDRIDSPTVSMLASVSHDGVLWTPPQFVVTSGNVHSNSEGIVRQAGISVAPARPNGQWFAAYADDANAIHVVRLPVTSDGFVDAQLISPSSTIVTGATTTQAPALSYLNGNLVLAWRVPGSTGEIRLLTTSDGTTWPNASTAATALVAGAAHTTQGAAPFLHASGDALFLTTTSGSAQGASNVDLFTSMDGVSFTTVDSFPAISAFLDPAAAGPAPTQFVVVQPSGVVDQTRVFTSEEPQRTLTFQRGRRVTVTGGPD
jgi:hypothetical protein